MALQQFFYDNQIRRYIIQFIRMISNFQVEFGRDRYGVSALQRVPVIYGDSSRQAASILRQNSENFLNSVPAMTVYINSFNYDRTRLQSPTYVGKMSVRERYYDPSTGDYSTTQGDILNVERLMPVPYKLSLKVDIWTSNTEQKLQLLEQLCTLFNPALEIQSTDNYIDWSSLSYVLLTEVQWSSRSVPVGTENPIDIATLTFELPVFINPPALIKKFGVIQKIIANVFDAAGNINEAIYDDANLLSKQYITPLQYGVILLDNQLTLVKYNEAITDRLGETIIKKLSANISGNTKLTLDNTVGVEPDMRIAGVRITGQGQITTNISSNTIVGSNTFFLTEIKPGYMMYTAAIGSNSSFIGNVSTINSNNSITLSSNAGITLTNNFYTFAEPLNQQIVKVLSVAGDVVVTNRYWTANVGDIVSFYPITTEKAGPNEPWRNLINVYGNLRSGISQISFEMPNGDEIIGTVAYNPQNDSALIWNVDIDTVPSNTIAPVNAIIDPINERPDRDLQQLANGTRYLLVNDYSSPTEEQPIYNWTGADNTPLVAKANDIIQYNGNHWFVSFNSGLVTTEQYMTNLTTGIQYRWDGTSWQKSYQGFYEAGKWQLIL